MVAALSSVFLGVPVNADAENSEIDFSNLLGGSSNKHSQWYERLIYVAAISRGRKRLSANYNETETIDWGDFIETYATKDKTDIVDDSVEFSFTVGGELSPSTSLYLSLSRENSEVEGRGEHESASLDYPDDYIAYTRTTKERGRKTAADIFMTHKLSRHFKAGINYYRENYKSDFHSLFVFDDRWVQELDQNLSGATKGGSIFVEMEKKYNSTSLGLQYALNRDHYDGEYFSLDPYSKKVHQTTAAVDHQWDYGVSSDLTLSHRYDATFTNDDPGYALTGPDKSHTWSGVLGLKYLLSDKMILLANYEYYSFNASSINFSVKYNIGSKKAPKRRKRNNSLLRITDFAR